jgi:hypothetical protein
MYVVRYPNHVTFPSFAAFRECAISEYTHNSEVLEGPGSLDVLKSLLKVLELSVDLELGLLGALDSLGLVGLNGLDLAVDVVLLDLEGVELLLDVVDDGGVLQDGAVVGEVDSLGLLGEDLDLAARIIVALLEGLEGLGGGATEAEFGAQVGPVDLGGGAALNGSVSRYCWLLGKSRTGAGCAISGMSGIRRIALSRGGAREGAVRTETAIVSAVWLVVGRDGGMLLAVEGLRLKRAGLPGRNSRNGLGGDPKAQLHARDLSIEMYLNEYMS